MVTTPPVYPLPRPLFPDGGASAYLSELLKTPPSGMVLLDGHGDFPGGAVHDLELLVSRVSVALSRWALPEFPVLDPLYELEFPAGAHPIALSGMLTEMQVLGRLTDEGAWHWAEGVGRDARRLSRSVASSAPGMAAMELLQQTVPTVWQRSRGRMMGGSWPKSAELLGQIVGRVYAAAARIHAWGPDAGQGMDAPTRSRRAAWAEMLDVVERHGAGIPFPVPSITAGDLMMLSGDARPEVRSLAVTLASHVVQSPQAGRRGR